MAESEVEKIIKAKHGQRHAWLGMPPCKKGRQQGIAVRALLSNAARCEVVELETGKTYPMEQLAKEGFFEGFIQKKETGFRYQLKVVQHDGNIRQFFDPYSFLPTPSEQDLYLFNQGNEH